MDTNFCALQETLNLLYDDPRLIHFIVELGARDCKETLCFEENYSSANILTFECNPSSLPICRERVSGKPRITLYEKAVSETNGKIKFYPIDPEKTETTWPDGNPGASSMFRASGKYPIENYVQSEIEVDSVRLDTILELYNHSIVDLLWMDLQGAELLALKGLGNRLKDVKVVHTEAEFMEIYNGQPLFKDIERFMLKNNFESVGCTYRGDFSCDAVFLNKAYFSAQQILSVSNFLDNKLIETSIPIHTEENSFKRRLLGKISKLLKVSWIG
jgi:FkbM family methyltransferase